MWLTTVNFFTYDIPSFLHTTLQFQVPTAYLYENLKVKIEKEQVWKRIAQH